MDNLYDECIKNLKTEEELKSIRENRNPLEWEERRKLAYDAAFNDIIIGAEVKIKNSMARGFSKSEIYKYYKFENKKFYGIYVSDILRKGDVIDRLSEHFKPFKVYLKRLNKERGQEKDVINISWYDKPEKPEAKPEKPEAK